MNVSVKIKHVILVCSALSSMANTGCKSSAQLRPAVTTAYKKEIEQWRQQRVSRLKGKLGWLKLSGLFWLKPGINHMGSDSSSDIVLPPRAPSSLASLNMKGQDVYLKLTPGQDARFRGKPVSEMLLLSDQEGKREPDIISTGDFTFFIIDRGGRKALRLFDQQAETLKSFKGIDYFPIDHRWRIQGQYIQFTQPRTVQVSTAIGTRVEEQVRGEVRFVLDGVSYSLQPVSQEGSNELEFVFADRTNGKQSYGGGRFLEATLSSDGKVILDFNKAYNPPCAFTSFATCPLPRAANRLPIKITAGEKVYKGHGHQDTMENW